MSSKTSRKLWKRHNHKYYSTSKDSTYLWLNWYGNPCPHFSAMCWIDKTTYHCWMHYSAIETSHSWSSSCWLPFWGTTEPSYSTSKTKLNSMTSSTGRTVSTLLSSSNHSISCTNSLVARSDINSNWPIIGVTWTTVCSTGILDRQCPYTGRKDS